MNSIVTTEGLGKLDSDEEYEEYEKKPEPVEKQSFTSFLGLGMEESTDCITE